VIQRVTTADGFKLDVPGIMPKRLSRRPGESLEHEFSMNSP